MDKLVELIGKILEKLTSAKLLWTLLIAIVIFALIYVFSKGAFNVDGCLKKGIGSASCPSAMIVSIVGLVAGSLIAATIVVWAAGLIKNKYFV